MGYSRLRVFYGPRETESERPAPQPHRVTVPLGDILSVLADAYENNSVWVQDFLSDDVTISSDLYDVLMAYEHYRRPAG